LSGISAYPLQWPAGWPRTPAGQRQEARFGNRVQHSREASVPGQPSQRWTSFRRGRTHNDALRHLANELERMGAGSVVISTNLELRGDGLPYANRRTPEDCGVAVYFTLPGDKQHRCMPCDRFDRVPDNLFAVAKSIEALRGLERWGGGRMVDAAFSGFKALPAMGSGLPWWDVLELPGPTGNTQADVERAFRRIAPKHHPDVTGGAPSKDWLALTEARSQALAATTGRTGS
jgi:hypothetical protein